MALWDVATGMELMALKGHTAPVMSVAFSSDRTCIVSGSRDKSVRVWDVSMIGYKWYLADKNWIISSPEKDHLMWVPQEANLVQDFNTLIISSSDFATVDFHQSMIGVDWVHCYSYSTV
jgi:WD40 repeat protein